MTRQMLILVAAAAGSLAALPAPASAQAGQTTVVIYGNDPCPKEAICIRKGESDRYRLPKDQQLKGTRQETQSWARRSQPLETIGATGPQSCSAVGPGGFTGCLTQEINQARREAKDQQQSDKPPQK
jgi:hypothetical protein